MKNILTLILFLVNIALCFSQERKEVENGVFVTFPTGVTYKANSKSVLYQGQTKNAIFMALVMKNAMPHYEKYVIAKRNWTKAETKRIEDMLLDNVVKGKLDYTGNTGSVSEIRIGKYNGRKVEYTAINPITGMRGKRFSILFLIRDRVVTFECMYLKNTSIAEQEKRAFFNSIKVM